LRGNRSKPAATSSSTAAGHRAMPPLYTRRLAVVIGRRVIIWQEAIMALKSEAARAGVSMGSALAITISWSANKSILWALVHGVFSWFYVIYYALKRAA
jgi:hypothetical protein